VLISERRGPLLLWERRVGILVVLLVAAWGLVLGPALLQSVGNSPMDTERMFRRSLRALGGRGRGSSVLGGRSILVPPKAPYPLQEGVVGRRRQQSIASRTAAERRRRNLTYLAVFIIATFLLGVFPPLRFLLVVNLVADVMLIVYLGLALYLAVWPPASERDGSVPAPVEELPASQPAADGTL